MANNMDLIDSFYSKIISQFNFLETDYGYIVIEKYLQNKDYFPDSEATVQYKGSPSHIIIEIFWYFASAVIGVAFKKITNEPDKPFDIINLYTLADYVSGGKEDMFLLKNTLNTDVSSIKKREKIIRDDLNLVVENLALAIKKYATQIIQGDTTIFEKIQEHQLKLLQKRKRYK